MDSVRHRLTIPGTREQPERVVALWVVTNGDQYMSAGIYLHPLGHELRIYRDQAEDRLFDSLLSPDGDRPLVLYANAVHSVLLRDGWTNVMVRNSEGEYPQHP